MCPKSLCSKINSQTAVFFSSFILALIKLGLTFSVRPIPTYIIMVPQGNTWAVLTTLQIRWSILSMLHWTWRKDRQRPHRLKEYRKINLKILHSHALLCNRTYIKTILSMEVPCRCHQHSSLCPPFLAFFLCGFPPSPPSWVESTDAWREVWGHIKKVLMHPVGAYEHLAPGAASQWLWSVWHAPPSLLYYSEQWVA